MNKIYFNNQIVKLEYENRRLNKQTLYFNWLKYNVFQKIENPLIIKK